MAYEIYKTKLDREKYFRTWTNDNYQKLAEDIKEEIYQKYVMKCEVLNRDKFKCQNILCKTPLSDLTLHHIKWQKNGGKDSSHNGVTLCKTCHKGYHRAKHAIQFSNVDYLPSHIRGHTFKLDAPDRGINWKQVKKEMKIFRKTLKDSCGLRLTAEQINILMRWLSISTEYSSEGNINNIEEQNDD